MKKALLIIDVQNDYFEKGKMELVNSWEASENIKILLEKFRKENLLVIHVQHIKIHPSATFFIPNTDGVKIHKNVEPIKNEPVVIKHFPNSFRETELLTHLKNNNISELVICGMMTHMCIDTTVRAAFDLGFECTVIGDACATRNLELDEEIVNARNVHIAFLAALNHTFAIIKNTKEY